MPRQQTIIQDAEIVLNAGQVHQLRNVQTFTKSFIIQASITNVDYLKIGNSVRRNIMLGPGEFYSFEADALDHGGGGMIDLQNIFVEAIVSSTAFTLEFAEGV